MDSIEKIRILFESVDQALFDQDGAMSEALVLPNAIIVQSDFHKKFNEDLSEIFKGINDQPLREQASSFVHDCYQNLVKKSFDTGVSDETRQHVLYLAGAVYTFLSVEQILHHFKDILFLADQRVVHQNYFPVLMALHSSHIQDRIDMSPAGGVSEKQKDNILKQFENHQNNPDQLSFSELLVTIFRASLSIEFRKEMDQLLSVTFGEFVKKLDAQSLARLYDMTNDYEGLMLNDKLFVLAESDLFYEALSREIQSQLRLKEPEKHQKIRTIMDYDLDPNNLLGQYSGGVPLENQPKVDGNQDAIKKKMAITEQQVSQACQDLIEELSPLLQDIESVKFFVDQLESSLFVATQMQARDISSTAQFSEETKSMVSKFYKNNLTLALGRWAPQIAHNITDPTLRGVFMGELVRLASAYMHDTDLQSVVKVMIESYPNMPQDQLGQLLGSLNIADLIVLRHRLFSTGNIQKDFGLGFDDEPVDRVPHDVLRNDGIQAILDQWISTKLQDNPLLLSPRDRTDLLSLILSQDLASQYGSVLAGLLNDNDTSIKFVERLNDPAYQLRKQMHALISPDALQDKVSVEDQVRCIIDNIAQSIQDKQGQTSSRLLVLLKIMHSTTDQTLKDYAAKVLEGSGCKVLVYNINNTLIQQGDTCFHYAPEIIAQSYSPATPVESVVVKSSDGATERTHPLSWCVQGRDDLVSLIGQYSFDGKRGSEIDPKKLYVQNGFKNMLSGDENTTKNNSNVSIMERVPIDGKAYFVNHVYPDNRVVHNLNPQKLQDTLRSQGLILACGEYALHPDQIDTPGHVTIINGYVGWDHDGAVVTRDPNGLHAILGFSNFLERSSVRTIHLLESDGFDRFKVGHFVADRSTLLVKDGAPVDRLAVATKLDDIQWMGSKKSAENGPEFFGELFNFNKISRR